MNEIPARAPPMTENILRAMVGWSVLHDHHDFALTLRRVLLAFATGELLAIQAWHVHMSSSIQPAVISLGYTKAGKRQGAAESITPCSETPLEVRDASLLEEIRSRILIEELGIEGEVVEVAPGQPFYLKLLEGVLEKAGDCDWQFLQRARTGCPLGVLEELPRTPAVFEQQVKWALDDDPSMQWDLAKGNYISATRHEGHLRDHLESEVEAGLMDTMSGAQFEEKYVQHTAIAALAVLVEDEASGKKRVIHDGTNKIGVNNRIRCKDKVRMPGPRGRGRYWRNSQLEGKESWHW